MTSDDNKSDDDDSDKNDHRVSALRSLKLTCWGVLNHCDSDTQRRFASTLKQIVSRPQCKRLWLRYAGINEFVLQHVIDGVASNDHFMDLKVRSRFLELTMP